MRIKQIATIHLIFWIKKEYIDSTLGLSLAVVFAISYVTQCGSSVVIELENLISQLPVGSF